MPPAANRAKAGAAGLPRMIMHLPACMHGTWLMHLSSKALLIFQHQHHLALHAAARAASEPLCRVMQEAWGWRAHRCPRRCMGCRVHIIGFVWSQ